MTTRACAGRLQEISNYLEFSPGPDLNVPKTEEDLINILNQMVPVQWHRSMTRNFLSPKAEREREMTMTLRMIDTMISTAVIVVD